MKTLLAFILPSLFVIAANAKTQMTQKTLVTCQQEDGDQWIEVGVTPYTKGNFRLAVVIHNTDDGSAKLEQEVVVAAKVNTAAKLVLSDKFETTKLAVNKRTKLGQFFLLKDGPGSLQDDRMSCYFNSTITWDTNSALEPRLSVGN